jgi:hypothetical protein
MTLEELVATCLEHPPYEVEVLSGTRGHTLIAKRGPAIGYAGASLGHVPIERARVVAACLRDSFGCFSLLAGC